MDKELNTLEMLASVYSDGHFTVMKFTTDWAVALCTVTYPEDIDRMFHGKTLNEAVCKLIRNTDQGFKGGLK